MHIKLLLLTVFCVDAAFIAYIKAQISSFYVTNNHQIVSQLNPCQVSLDYVAAELALLYCLAAAMFLLFLYLFHKSSSSHRRIGLILSYAMLGILLILSVPVVHFHFTGISVM